MKKIRVGIFGGSGYGGAELLRILLPHPSVEIALVTANEHAERAVGEVHKNLYGLTDLRFTRAPEGRAEGNVAAPAREVEVVRSIGRFRLSDADVFAEHYGREHTAIEAQR